MITWLLLSLLAGFFIGLGFRSFGMFLVIAVAMLAAQHYGHVPAWALDKVNDPAWDFLKSTYESSSGLFGGVKQWFIDYGKVITWWYLVGLVFSMHGPLKGYRGSWISVILTRPFIAIAGPFAIFLSAP